MRNIQALLLVVLMSLASSTTIAETAAERPDGISASEWIEITDSLGFVITSEGSLPMTGQALLLDPPVAGYFMIKREGGWTRIVVSNPMQGVPPSG